MNEIARKSIQSIQEKVRKQLEGKSTIDLQKIHKKLYESIATTFEQVRKNVTNVKDEANFILPTNCRFFKQSKGLGACIVEYSPMRRTVFTQNTTHNVPFPYFYFFAAWQSTGNQVAYRGLGVGARTSPLSSPQDMIGLLPLAHTHGNDQICIPMQTAVFNSANALMQNFIQTFWQSKFVYQFEQFMVGDKLIKSFQDWEKLDTTDMLKAQLREGYSANALITRYVANNNNPFQAMIGQTEASIQSAIATTLRNLSE